MIRLKYSQIHFQKGKSLFKMDSENEYLTPTTSELEEESGSNHEDCPTCSEEESVSEQSEQSDHEDCPTCSEEELMSEDESPTTSDEEIIVSDEEEEDEVEELIEENENLKKENKLLKNQLKTQGEIIWGISQELKESVSR